MLKLSRDTNGNKTLKLIGNSECRGFSVQTNGNLPRTHRMDKYNFNDSTAENELHAFIKVHGTARQKEMLGWW